MRWRPVALEPFDMAEMMRLTLHIVSSALFSTDIADEADSIGAAFNMVNRHMAQHSSAPIASLKEEAFKAKQNI